MSHPWGIRLLYLRSSGPFMGEKRDCSEGRNCVSARGHETAYGTKDYLEPPVMHCLYSRADLT